MNSYPGFLCFFADVSKTILPVLSRITVFSQGNLQSEKVTTLTVEEEEEGWSMKPQLKHILSILLVHPFLAYVTYKTQMKNFICLPLQQSVKNSLKMEVTHLCNCGLRHQFSPIVLTVNNSAPLVTCVTDLKINLIS